MDTALSIEHVSHWYGSRQVLFDVNLSVPRGSITTVIGPSGQGKTTLLRIVSGFETPRVGVVRIGSRTLTENGKILVPSERRGVSVVPQEGALFPHLSVGGNVAFGLSQRRSAKSKKRVEEVLALVGLSGMQKMRPHELSGGMQQRVALARALAPQPDLILLDEPFASLDTNLRESVRDETIRTLRSAGATVLWVTHDQEEALANSDQIAVLFDGRIRQIASPVDLYSKPVDKKIAEFVGEIVMLRGEVGDQRGVVKCVLGNLAVNSTSDVSGDAFVVIRPEHIQIVGDSHAESVVGEVVSTKFFGHDAVVHVKLSTAEIATVRVRADNIPELGNKVRIAVRGDVQVFKR